MPQKLSSQNLLKRLLQTGWQSWSTSTKKSFFSPLFNFSPHPKSLSSKPKIKLSQKLKKPAYGWCSWYSHGPKITEEKILKQARWLAKHKKAHRLPIDYLLIDDGWCAWGDWTSENTTKFSHGLKAISQKIKAYGLKSGIWLAPFLVHPDSKLAKTHPDWLVRKEGRLVEGLRLTAWDRFFHHKKWILDLKNPQVQKYLDQTLHYLVKDCGFELLKIDFLYALHFDPNLSGLRADTFLRKFLRKIKTRYPQVYTIACGCPLIPAVGVVDSMRIGPDTTLGPIIKILSHPFFARWYLDKQVIPALQKRLWTKSLWNIDPDVFICRKSLGFTAKLLKKFQKVVKSGQGNIFLGDDLTKLSKRRIKKYLLPLFN